MGSHTTASLPVARLVGVGLIVFLANAVLLVLQLVAGRLLAPFVGSSLETWTSIIGVFLLGIALGNAFGGRLADRYPSPRTLAIVLAFGALTAVWMVLFPTVLNSSGAYKSIPLGPRIPILALALCLPAGFVLSLLTPLAIKLGLPDVAHTGRVAGMVFALSTLGCLLGNYLTGFVLIPAFTINTLTFASAGSLAVLAAGTMVFLGETRGPEETPSTGQQLPAQQLPAQQVPVNNQANESIPRPANPHAFSDIRLAYLIVFLASFGGMTLELTASRVLAQQLGVSLFTWTGIIGVMLTGTALGNFIGGLFADRAAQPGGMRRPLAWLAALVSGFLVVWLVYQGLPWACWRFGVKLGLSVTVLQVVAATVAAVAGFGVYHAVARVTEESVNPRTMLAVTLMSAGAGTVLLFVVRTVLSHSSVFDHLHPIGQVMGWTFSLFFLPMLILGMVSPQVIRLSVPDVAHAGRVAGRVYAWSTVGAIVGTFAAGYFTISTFGMDRTLLGVSLILTLTSLLVAKVWDSNPMLYLFSVVLGGVCGGFILTGRDGRDEGLVGKLETNYYTIKVSETRDGIRVLTLDHLIHSSVDPKNPSFLYYEHEHIQMEFLWAARVGAANPRSLVIGGGGYTFPRYAMTELPETRMDVVEIDPGVTQVAKEHLGLKDYDGLNIIHMDGRQYVTERVAPGTYDLVVQDAVNDLSVPSHLLTKEYNDAIKRTLTPDGVYLLTVIDSIRYGRLWRSAMRTLKESFAHVELVSSNPIPPEAPPPGATEREIKEWKAELRHFQNTRQVLVIFAADHPLDVESIRKEAYRHLNFGPKAALGAFHGLIAEGPAAAPAYAVQYAYSRSPFFTNVVPAHRLTPFLDADPGVLLTDQFAPVDNLMAEVFRYRYRDRPDEEKEEGP